MIALPWPGARGVLASWRLATRRGTYLALAISLYLVLMGALLVSSDFVPYVTDNNESFSMYIHARNMLRFGIGEDAGLSDEAYGTQAAEHAYVYTHEGNLPRWPVYLLMRLGVTSIEWQIGLHAFFLGTLTIYLCFRFFSTAVDDLFAFLVCAVFATDYLLFMQWEANTFRVWHGVFFFLGLVCVQALGRGTARRTGFLLFLASVGLFYFEIAFAFFTAATWVCYAALLYWRRRELALRVVLLTVGGALIAIFGLVGQSITYLGWPAAWEDIRLTFINRNFLTQRFGGSGVLTTLQFFLSHHIVYWLDNPDTRRYLSVGALLKTLGLSVLRIDTPYFVLLGMILTLGWGWRTARRVKVLVPRERILSGTAPAHRRAAWTPARLWAVAPTLGTGIVLAVLFYVAAGLTSSTSSRLALSPETGPYGALAGFPTRWFVRLSPRPVVITLLMLAFVYFEVVRAFIYRMSPFRWRSGVLLIDLRQSVVAASSHVIRISLQDAVIAILFLCSVVLYALNHWRAYGTGLAPLWLGAIEGYFNHRLLQAELLGTVVFALVIVVEGRRRYLPARHDQGFVATLRYLAAGGLGFAFTYLVVPGYLSAGYLSRYTPLPVFVVDVWIALVFYMLALVAGASRRRMAAGPCGHRASVISTSEPSAQLLATPSLMFVLSVLLLIFSAVYWARIQVIYVSTLPPTSFLNLRQLGDGRYRGATFVSNTYSAPIAYYTGTWAYADEMLPQSIYRLRSGRLTQVIGGEYLWEADRATNADYLRPQYYLCFVGQTLNMAADLMALPVGNRLTNCSSQPIVRDAEEHAGSFFNVLLAKDPSPRDMWAIVRLDSSLQLTRLR